MKAPQAGGLSLFTPTASSTSFKRNFFVHLQQKYMLRKHHWKTLKNRMRLPLAIAVQIATALLLCGPISAAPSCPAQWVQHPGVCLFPRKDQYKNFSVASSPQQEWGSECCSACATDERCASWLLYIEKKGGAPGTSVLCALTRLVWHVACARLQRGPAF